MLRSDADLLLRIPIGSHLTLETTLAVPLRGAAVGNNAKIVGSTAE